MFALQARLMMGRYEAASQQEDRAEWPPHPARLVQALISMYKEHGGGDGERQALLWLEEQLPPAISASQEEKCIFSSYTSFVPNMYPDGKDVKNKDIVSKHLSPTAAKRPVSFPACQPPDPIVQFIWDCDPGKHLPALQQLARRLNTLGTSRSPVLATIITDPARISRPMYVPDKVGKYNIRVPADGMLEDCEWAYQARQSNRGGANSKRCGKFQWQRYECVANKPSAQIVKVLEFITPMPAIMMPFLIKPIKASLMAIAQSHGEVPSWLSGHAADGSVAQCSELRLRYLPLLGRPRTRVEGMALTMTSSCPSSIVNQAVKLVNTWLDQNSTIFLSDTENTVVSLAPDWWSLRPYIGKGQKWATITPIVLDRWPPCRRCDPHAYPQIEPMVVQALQQAGITQKVRAVQIMSESFFQSVPKDRDWSTLTPDGRPVAPAAMAGAPILPRVHAAVIFESDVEGPVLVGKGRFQGMGMMRLLRS